MRQDQRLESTAPVIHGTDRTAVSRCPGSLHHGYMTPGPSHLFPPTAPRPRPLNLSYRCPAPSGQRKPSRHASWRNIHGRGRQVAILDRPGRYLHRRGRAPARRPPADAQAAVRESRTLPGRRDPRHPRTARPGRRRRHSAGCDRSREDGHDGCDERAARAQRRAHAAGYDARIPRRPAHRLPAHRRHPCRWPEWRCSRRRP